jgi:hypothetical protein
VISGGEMERAVSAADIVPNYAETSGLEEEAEDDTADHTDDLTYDLCNLIACDYHTLRFETTTREEVIHESATRAAQLLINRLVLSLLLSPHLSSSDYSNCQLNPQRSDLLLFFLRKHSVFLGMPSPHTDIFSPGPALGPPSSLS